MRLTTRSINRFLKKHRKNVYITCEEQNKGIFLFRGSFMLGDELYQGSTLIPLAQIDVDSEFMILTMIDGYENDFKKIVDKLPKVS